MNDLIERYEKNFLRNDLFVCILFMLAIFFLDKLLEWSIYSFMASSLKNTIYPTTTSGSLTVFVFLLTCISIIIGYLQEKKLEQLADSGQPKTIMKTFFSAIRWTGLLAAISFIAPLPWNKKMDVIFFWFAFALFIISITRVTRTIWIVNSLANLLFRLKEPKNK
jgi:hypothetical protein